MRKFVMFITAVCVLFLIKLRWPRNKSLYDAVIVCNIKLFEKYQPLHAINLSVFSWLLSINWPASSVWVFIAQLVEHCSANVEATGSNPVEAPKSFFSGFFAIA